MKKLSILTLIIISSLLFIPTASYAAGIVPCSGLQCNLCFFFVLIQNIINFFLYTLTPIVVAGAIIYGGFLIMFSGVTDKINQGKKIIQTALISMIIVFMSWTFIDITIRAIAGSQSPVLGQSAKWYELGSVIQCR